MREIRNALFSPSNNSNIALEQSPTSFTVKTAQALTLSSKQGWTIIKIMSSFNFYNLLYGDAMMWEKAPPRSTVTMLSMCALFLYLKFPKSDKTTCLFSTLKNTACPLYSIIINLGKLLWVPLNLIITRTVESAKRSFLISHQTESVREQPPPLSSPLKGHHCVWRIAMATADEL